MAQKTHSIEIRIISENGNEEDIKLIFDKITLFYNMDNVISSGNIQISEQKNLISTLPIIGKEKIFIKFQTFNENDNIIAHKEYENTFYVYAVDNLLESCDVRSYTIRFTDALGLINNDKRICMRYNDKAENIINEIFKGPIKSNNNFINNSKFKSEIETVYPINILVPNWKPLVFLGYLTNSAVDKLTFDTTRNKYADCLFFQRTNGEYVFTSYNNIIKQANNNFIKFIKRPANMDYTDNEKLSKNIINYSFSDLFNVQVQKLSGMLGHSVFGVDFATKQTNKIERNYDNIFFEINNSQKTNIVKLKPFSSLTQSNECVNSISFYNVNADSVSSQDFSTTSDNEYGKLILPRDINGISINHHLHYLKMGLEINGSSELDIGTPIRIDLGAHGTLGENAVAKYLNSVWIITKIKHEITLSSCTTYLEISTPAFSEDMF